MEDRGDFGEQVQGLIMIPFTLQCVYIIKNTQEIKTRIQYETKQKTFKGFQQEGTQLVYNNRKKGRAAPEYDAPGLNPEEQTALLAPMFDKLHV